MNESLTKVVIDLPPGDLASAETLWCAEIAPGRYQLLNVPLWAYGLAYEDVIEAEMAEDQRLHYVRLAQRSGLLTVRVAGPDADPASYERLISVLQRRASATERYDSTYCAFAMSQESLGGCEEEIDAAEREGMIQVEIANEDEE